MKIALLGYGKMGKSIEKIALERGHKIVIKSDSNTKNYDISKADIAIEFSNPDIAFENLKNCIENNIPVVCGTTGWLDKYESIENSCKKNNSAFLYASNFSIGVNLFFKLNEYLTKMMNNISDYKAEIEEIHHIHKLDAPSGTAITLANSIIDNSKIEKWSLKNSSDKEVLIKVKREDEVPGTHTVTYTSKVDKIDIKHEAFNRSGFAVGAVFAAEWLIDKKGVFSMKDVLKF